MILFEINIERTSFLPFSTPLSLLIATLPPCHHEILSKNIF
jgi:hypothetical protein